jgi:OOP family OmpA-OmpF porin
VLHPNKGDIVNKIVRLLLLAAGSMPALFAVTATAQNESTTGYLTDQRGQVVKTAFNVCWRTGYWTPAMALAQCDPDLVKKPEPPKPAPPPPPPPKRVEPPKPAPAAPAAPKPLSVTATVLWDTNNAKLSDTAKATIDREVLAKLAGFATVRIVLVSGHADRLGSQQANQALSVKRAKAVEAYLFSKGVSVSTIEAAGFGKTVPVKFGCDDKLPRKKLVECLAPNRRVVIEVAGTAK